MAEIMFNAMLDDEPRFQAANFRAYSAGMNVFRSESISPNAAEVLARRDLLSADHFSRQISEEMMESAALVLTMTTSQRDLLREFFPEYVDRIFSLKEFATGTDGDVSDPFGGSVEVYEQTAQEIEQLVRQVLERLLAS